jgi:hypothetical protein
MIEVRKITGIVERRRFIRNWANGCSQAGSILVV